MQWRTFTELCELVGRVPSNLVGFDVNDRVEAVLIMQIAAAESRPAALPAPVETILDYRSLQGAA